MAPYRAVALYTFTMEQVQSCMINVHIIRVGSAVFNILFEFSGVIYRMDMYCISQCSASKNPDNIPLSDSLDTRSWYIGWYIWTPTPHLNQQQLEDAYSSRISGMLYFVMKYYTDKYNIYYVYRPASFNGRQFLHQTAIIFVISGAVVLQFSTLFFSVLRLGRQPAVWLYSVLRHVDIAHTEDLATCSVPYFSERAIAIITVCMAGLSKQWSLQRGGYYYFLFMVRRTLTQIIVHICVFPLRTHTHTHTHTTHTHTHHTHTLAHTHTHLVSGKLDPRTILMIIVIVVVFMFFLGLKVIGLFSHLLPLLMNKLGKVSIHNAYPEFTLLHCMIQYSFARLLHCWQANTLSANLKPLASVWNRVLAMICTNSVPTVRNCLQKHKPWTEA